VLRLVADTNIVVSALLWHGAPPRALRRAVGRDPDDAAVLACAVAARADLVVSGDQDLLVLKTYSGIRIIGANEALAVIAGR
jgi:predicted nucleic acid-binding protein